MIVETLILDSHKSVSQIFRDLGHGDRYSVGVGGYQFGGLVAVDIIDKSRKTGRGNIQVFNVRCGGDNAVKYADTCRRTNDAHRNNSG